METIKELYNKYYNELNDRDVHAYAIGYDWLYDNNKLFKTVADNFAKERGDFISTDKEAAAMCKAVETIGQYDDTRLCEFIRNYAKGWYIDLNKSDDTSLVQFYDVKGIKAIEEKFNNKNLLVEKEM